MAADPAAPAIVHVACLCAAWCRLCDDYRSVMDGVLAEFVPPAGIELRPHWIDIEDEAELLGDFDVETFPTIVIAGPEGLRFAGPLTPQPDTLRRLLRATLLEAGSGGARAGDPELDAFAQRLRHLVNPGR